MGLQLNIFTKSTKSMFFAKPTVVLLHISTKMGDIKIFTKSSFFTKFTFTKSALYCKIVTTQQLLVAAKTG